VPDRLRFAYVFLLVLNLFIIPEYVLESRLNTAGEFLNFLTFDLLFYVFANSMDFNKEE
jgi:hypothetical protein